MWKITIKSEECPFRERGLCLYPVEELTLKSGGKVKLHYEPPDKCSKVICPADARSGSGEVQNESECVKEVSD